MDDTQKALAAGINPMLVKLYNMLPNYPQHGAAVDPAVEALSGPGITSAQAIMPMLKSILQGLEFQQSAVASPGGMREEALQNPGEGLTDPKTGVKIPTLQAIPAKVPAYAGGKTQLQSNTPLPPMDSTGGSGMPAQMYGQLPPDVTPGDIDRWQRVLSNETSVAKNVPGEEAPPPPDRKPAPPKPAAKSKPKTAAKKQVEELPWLVRGLGQQ